MKTSKMSNVCIVCEKPVLKDSNPKMSLHLFPANAKKRQIWLKQCNITKEVLPTHKVCSQHFELKCFKTNVKRRLLYPDAIPTIFEDSHDKSAIVPVKISRGRPKNCTKNGIVKPNRKSPDISLVKAAKKVVAGRNRKSRDVAPVSNTHFDRINNILDAQIEELNVLGDTLAELSKEKLTLASILTILVKNQINMGNLIK